MKATLQTYILFLTGILISGICFAPIAQAQKAGITSAEFGSEDVATPQSTNTTNMSAPLFSKDKPVQPKDEIVSLRFAWNTPVNMASFKRNGKIWIVFDRPNRFDLQNLKSEAKHMAKEIYSLPHPNGSIIIITPNSGVEYSLRKEGLLWIVDLYTGRPPNFKIQNLTIFTQYDSLKNSYLFIPTIYAGNTISLIDPEIGDIISISTNSQLGLGFDSPYRYPDFDILPTTQGLAFVINSPDIILNRGNSGITLKAMGRTLNINSDLDVLKRNQFRLTADRNLAHANAFNLQISSKLANKPLSEVIDDFRKQILSAPLNQKNNLRLKLAQYYVHNGLGTNALYILNQMRQLDLPETKSDHFYALSGIANFLARRYQKAVNDFSQGSLPNLPEGVFWRTIAQSAYNYDEKNNTTIFANISLMRDYPQAIKDEVAIIAARNAIATGDDLSSQNFIDILRSVPDRLRNLDPQITYLSAQKLEMQGYIRNAIKEYQKLLDSESTMFSALARMRYVVLGQMVDFIDLKTAIAELEKLRFAWGEREFKIKLLNKLAEYYLKDNNYYKALTILNEEGFLVEGPQKEQVANKMLKIFEDIFIGNHADEALSPIKSLALYQDFKWLADRSPQQTLIAQKLADRLVAVDLLSRAQDLLLSLLYNNKLSADSEGRVGARLAVIYLFENKPQDALNILEATNRTGFSPETINPRRIITARALSALGKTTEALALIQDDYSPNAILNKFEIYWNAQDWDNASNTIKQMIKEPVAGKKLSTEQINYILDWATTLKQAGKETVLVRLRNKFSPYFINTPYESAFNVLTNHLEKEEIDIKAIRSIISDVASFNNYAKFYTQTLEETPSEENE